VTAGDLAGGPGTCECAGNPAGYHGRKVHCPRCRLLRRLGRLLDDGTGTIRPELAPLTAALAAGPAAALRWTEKPHVTELLTALARGQVPLTHDGLNAWPEQVAAKHMRHRLIGCGILPAADPQLLALEAWFCQRLAALAGDRHEQLLRQFAHWHQLPRLRATAAARPLRSTARQYAMLQFTQAQNFLHWLDQDGIRPAGLAQARIDTWFATRKVHERQHVRGFLLWATGNGALPRHLDIPTVTFQSGAAALPQQQRTELLRRFLAPGHEPHPGIAAACLLLLYAQPLTRIHRLTASDILDDGSQMHIRFGDPPAPVPAPLAEILRQLPRNPDSPWLFPGLLPGQPIGYPTLREQVSHLGLPMRQARISALRQLVLDAPAPVIAGALGFHQTTTTRQVAHAGGTWNRYPASHPPAP
jgi:hypothetical protein